MIKYWVTTFGTKYHRRSLSDNCRKFIQIYAFSAYVQKFYWYDNDFRHNNTNVCYVRKSMNPLTSYIEFSPKPFFNSRSLIRNFITSILTIKDTWHLWQMPKVFKKENQYTYYHNSLKYVSLILRIRKWYFVENLNEKPERKHWLYYTRYYKGICVAHLMILANYF